MEGLKERLQAPFKPDEIEWRVGSTTQDKTKGLALAYVTNRAIQNRLDDLFGVFGWRNEYREWKGNSQLCGISIWSDEREEWITKWDGASDSNMEATKGGLSDAMKRAGYQWGIGRYLYNLPDVWMPLKQRGSSYVLAEIPKLPSWALPEGVVDKHGNSVLYDKAVETFNNTPAEDIEITDDDVAGDGTNCGSCGTELNEVRREYCEQNLSGQYICFDCQSKKKKQKEVA